MLCLRAWRISALAVRSAITLGINMKNCSADTPNISKEARYRVWWCLYTFEHLLGIMTGRATCIQDGVCTTPLPVPFDEDLLSEPAAAELLNNSSLRDERINEVMSSAWVRHMPLNPTGGKVATASSRQRDCSWLKNLPFSVGLCHLYYCDLSVVSQEIVNRVYSVDCVMVPWSHIENRIGELRSRCDLWYSSLPPSLDFTQTRDDDSDVLRCKLALAFQYYSARITLGRPCLCRRDANRNGPNGKSTFSHDMAVLTLESASRMLDLIPDETNAVQLYAIAPWWCVLHFLMQAATVLLLELSFGCVHVPEEEQNLVQMAKKSVRWLYAMSAHSIASRRAWRLCDLSLRRLATGMEFDVSDMPSNFEDTPPSSNHSAMDPGQQELNGQTHTGHWGPHLDDLSVSNPPEQTATPFSYPHYSTTDPLASLTGDGPITDDLYFPYDPISGEFIRSFFPQAHEEERWEPHCLA